MQKIINGIAIFSGVVALGVVGLGGYVFIRKDAIIDGVKSKVMGSVLDSVTPDLGGIAGDDELTVRTELDGGVGKYGRLLGWLYVGDGELSLNEEMITEGYAWEYDGGTKQKNFEELREIRRSFGTLLEG